MKQLKLFFALFAMLALGVGNAWAEEVTYVFTSKDWAAKIGSTAANWTSNKSGAGFSNNGIQVTTAASGANGTSPISYDNISQIIVTYNTNKSKGQGTLSVKIGDNAVTTNNWKYSGSANGTTANFTSTFDYPSPQSGKVTLTANTTTNSIYVVSIKIVTSAGGETPDPTPVTISLNKTELNLQEGATETLTATVTGSTESVTWSSNAIGVASVDNTGKVTAVAAGNATITAAIGDVKATCAVTVTAATTPEEPGTGGETTTVTYVFKDDSNCPGNDKTWFSGTIDEYTGWTATKGTNDPKYYDTGTGLRIYNGGKFTITSTKVMTSITLTFSGTGYTFSADNTTNPQIVTPNAKSYEWSVSRTCRLQKIEITYAADAGGSTEPVVSLIPKNELF